MKIQNMEKAYVFRPMEEHIRTLNSHTSSNGFQTTSNHYSVIFHQRELRWTQPSLETQLPSEKCSRELPNNSQPFSIWNLFNSKNNNGLIHNKHLTIISRIWDIIIQNFTNLDKKLKNLVYKNKMQF